MPEVSVKDQLKKLVEIQKADQQIYNFNQDLKEKPALVEELKQTFESSKIHLNELEEKVKAIQVDRKSSELELQAKEEEITKANADLSQIKTNKEYTAKITEIENIKADKSIIEEKILVSYDDADKVNADIEKEKVQVAEAEKVFLAKKKEVEEEIKVIEDQIKTLESQRNQLAPGIDGVIRTQYEKILSHKDGLAIAPVNGNSCGGCFMNITAQDINRIKMGEEIVHCESCTRILYIEEDL